MKKESESYYICPECSELSTQTDLENDSENGGSGMCYCRFTEQIWNPEINNFDCQTNRTFVEYTEISKKWFSLLKKIKNNIERLNLFIQIPKEKLK